MNMFVALHSFSDEGLLALRLGIGIIFLYHCRSKFKNIASFMGFIGVAECIGGLAVLSGFLTQLAALGLSIIMLGAMYRKMYEWNVPFSAMDKMGWEFDFMIFCGCMALLTLGAGGFALDPMLFGL